jgi:hypothetical protein
MSWERLSERTYVPTDCPNHYWFKHLRWFRLPQIAPTDCHLSPLWLMTMKAMKTAKQDIKSASQALKSSKQLKNRLNIYAQIKKWPKKTQDFITE